MASISNCFATTVITPKPTKAIDAAEGGRDQRGERRAEDEQKGEEEDRKREQGGDARGVERLVFDRAVERRRDR